MPRGCCACRRVASLSFGGKAFFSFFKALRWPAFLILSVALVRGTDSTFNHLARAVGASADVTVAASELAVKVLNSTSSGISVVASLAWAMTSSSMGAFEATWSDIDLVNVSAWRSQGKLVAPAPELLAAWLGSAPALRVTACDDALVHATWSAGVRSLSAELNFVQNSQDFLDTHGSFSRVSFEVRLLELGEVVLTYELLNASFVPQWANPLWTLLEMDLDAQSSQIAGLLDFLVQQVPRSAMVDYQVSELDSVQQGLSVWEARKLRALRALRPLCILLLQLLEEALYWLCRGWGFRMLLISLLSVTLFWGTVKQLKLCMDHGLIAATG